MWNCTIVQGGSSVIWLVFLGDFGTKICYFIRKNMAENGPLVFCTVLYSKYDEKLGNHERKNIEIVRLCSNLQYQVYLSLPDAKGQIISECPYEIIVWTKIATKKFPRFLS